MQQPIVFHVRLHPPEVNDAVAAAYALAPFASLSAGTTNIGTSASNLLGLGNALAPASNLVNTTSGGQAQATNAINGMVLPTAEINTLADILSACVNTNTVAGTSTTCSTLFTAATPPGGIAPGDTFQAAIDIALNPGNNAATLYGLAGAIAPYQPVLSSAPTDFAVGIQYNGGPIVANQTTAGIDIDAFGDAWVDDVGLMGANSNITEISPAGAILSGANGYLQGSLFLPQGLAIDSAGDIFATDYDYGLAVEVFSGYTNFTYLTPSSLAGAGPVGIAIDNRTNTSWIANDFSSTATHMTAGGADAIGSPYAADHPDSVATDNSGNIWVINTDAFSGETGAGTLTELSPSGGNYTAQNFATGTGTFPFDLAIDNSNDVWVTDFSGVAKFNSAGTQLSPVGGYAQNATNSTDSIIVDGMGRPWVSNTAVDGSGNVVGIPGSVTVFSNGGTLLSTAATATTGGSLLGYTAVGTIPVEPYFPQGIKIDASGDVWITGYNPAGTQVVTELIGIAAPLVTPLSVASSTGMTFWNPAAVDEQGLQLRP